MHVFLSLSPCEGSIVALFVVELGEVGCRIRLAERSGDRQSNCPSAVPSRHLITTAQFPSRKLCPSRRTQTPLPPRFCIDWSFPVTKFKENSAAAAWGSFFVLGI
jgi:hypothetical protein